MDLLQRVVAYARENFETIVTTLLSASVVLGIGYALAVILAKSARRAIARVPGTRSATLAPVAGSLTFILVMGAAVVTALDHLGVDVAALLAGAGILGLAVGFGAQSLVKDCLSGFFLILDDVIAQGDVVEINGVSGVVENVGLRVTRIRAFTGQLWYVPNGEITKVGNWMRGWARVVVNIGVAYEHDVVRAMEVLRHVGEQWAQEHEHVVLEPPEVQGIMGFNASDIGIRLVIKIDNKDKLLWPTERELRLRIKAAFDREGVEIPFPRQVVYHRQEGDSALRIEDGNDASARSHRAATAQAQNMA